MADRPEHPGPAVDRGGHRDAGPARAGTFEHPAGGDADGLPGEDEAHQPVGAATSHFAVDQLDAAQGGEAPDADHAEQQGLTSDQSTYRNSLALRSATQNRVRSPAS